MSTKLTTSHSTAGDMSNKLMADLRSAVAEGEQMLKQMGNVTADEIASARSRIESTAHDARAQLHDARIVVGKRARQAADVSVEYVKENPLKTLGVVAVVALIAGFLFNRRH